MRSPIRFIVSFHAFLLRFYPRQFRDEFGEEMTAVFAEALSEAGKQGYRLVAIRVLRELRDYPTSLWREQKLSRRKRKKAAGLTPLIPDDDVAEPVPLTRPSGPEIAAAILPFVLMGLFYTYKALDYASGRRSLPFYWFLFIFLVLLTGLFVGWVRGFPRWSLGYLGMALIYSWWLAGVATNGFRIFGHTFGHNEQWGWRGYISLLGVALAATLVSRSLYPLSRLVTSFWRDWSRLSFVIYGALSWLALGIAYDGKSFYNEVSYLPINIIIGAIIFVAGALIYMRLKTRWQSAVALQAAFNLAFLSSMALDGRDDAALPGNIYYWLFMVFFWFSLILWPGLLGIFRRASQSLRPV